MRVEFCLLFGRMGETKRPTDLGTRARAPGSRGDHSISWSSAGCPRLFSQTSIWHRLPMNRISCRVLDVWASISSRSGPDSLRMGKQGSGQTKSGKSRGGQTPGRAPRGPGHAESGGCLEAGAGYSAEEYASKLAECGANKPSRVSMGIAPMLSVLWLRDEQTRRLESSESSPRDGASSARSPRLSPMFHVSGDQHETTAVSLP